ncbi:SEC-C metal-binding domain-containing protein [Bacillus salipaludis]|uniref:SEC-C metal-binding domain-containing protein n=1 Tax=Bacillus salipaludis TaxID=2547811 RepID=UPI002E1ED374|nr:SEC-C metal-binding domain-containing protein [Bacillus salipaludis]
MSNKVMDKQLEKGLLKALSGFKKMSKDIEGKQEQKHWGNLNVPVTLQEQLGKMTKSELDNIRKNLDLKGVSSLKKAELVTVLQEMIPKSLEQVCLPFDAECFRLLTKIAHNGGHMIAPDLEPHQIEYFRARGLIFTGTFQGKRILAVPDELIVPIISLEDNKNLTSIINRNTEWIKLTYGLCYYYGTLSTAQLSEMLETFTKEPLRLREFLDVIHHANSYHKGINLNEEGFSNRRVFDPKRVKQEHRMRESVAFFPFTKKQLLKAGEAGFVEKNQSYLEFVQFLTLYFEMDREAADSIVEECVYATRIGDGPNEVMQYLGSVLEFESLETVQAIMDQVVHLMNNTKRWFLKGYTPIELREHSLKPELLTSPKQTEGITNEKIGRNNPCPCGSGKKYKKCCGR